MSALPPMCQHMKKLQMYMKNHGLTIMGTYRQLTTGKCFVTCDKCKQTSMIKLPETRKE